MYEDIPGFHRRAREHEKIFRALLKDLREYAKNAQSLRKHAEALDEGSDEEDPHIKIGLRYFPEDLNPEGPLDGPDSILERFSPEDYNERRGRYCITNFAVGPMILHAGDAHISLRQGQAMIAVQVMPHEGVGGGAYRIYELSGYDVKDVKNVGAWVLTDRDS